MSAAYQHWMILLGISFPVTLSAERTATLPGYQDVLSAVQRRQPGWLLDRPARLKVVGVPLAVALNELHRSSQVNLVFSPALLPDSVRVTCRCGNLSLGEALDRILQSTDLEYREFADQVAIGPGASARRQPLSPNPPVRAPDSTPPEIAVDSSFLQAGSVAGAVTDIHGRPLEAAQVALVGNPGRSAMTDPTGRFRLNDLSGAAATIRVTRVGYAPASREVRVGDLEIRISLAELPVNLDEVIVTGTAVSTEKRAIGNSVVTVDAARLNELAPASDVSRLLNGRAPGVVFQPASGAAGGGGRIRVRGASSLSLSNEPLIYVDGVRMDNSTRNALSGGAISRLNDVNPESIESIEVIRGPAAATLYGTEASNGVIQIITKKGTPGKARVTLQVSQGASWLSNPEGRFPTSYQRNSDGSVSTLNLVQAETDRGTPLFRTGLLQRYGASATGGSAELQYYADAQYDEAEGVLAPNRLRQFAGRSNLQATFRPKLVASISAGYVSSRTALARQYTEVSPLAGAFYPQPGLLGTPTRGFHIAPSEAFLAAFNDHQEVDRFTIGAQLRHHPNRWFAQRLTVGVDDVDEGTESVVPRLPETLAQFFGETALGVKFLERRDFRSTTVDYGASAAVGRDEGIGARTAVGFQYYRKLTTLVSAQGRQFPAPGVTTISSAAVRNVTETPIENVTVGVYIEQQLSWKRRAFLTGAIRADDNSAFGEAFDLVTYPKVSGAWVISEEPFWPANLINTLRLRAAYGESGQQPNAFAALRTYRPITGPGNTTAIQPQSVGNAGLGPERGEEREIGFEAGLLADRLGVDFTYYHKRTRGAILQRTVAPSSGFTGPQFVNVGEIRNKGFELVLRATPVTTPRFTWDVRFALSRNDNQVVDLGGASPITLGVNQEHRPGYPIGGFFERIVLSAGVGANGTLTNPMCDGGVGGRAGGSPVPCATAPRLFFGQPLPKHEGAINTTVTLFERLTVSGLFDFKTGHRVFESNIGVQCLLFTLCEANAYPERDPAAAVEYRDFIFGPSTTVSASFAKLRQVTASYRIPERWMRRFGAAGGAFAVSARNIATFSRYPGVDPDIVGTSGDDVAGQHYYTTYLQLPHPFELRASLKLAF